MAVALQHKTASEIQVREVMSRNLFICNPDNDSLFTSVAAESTNRLELI